MKEGNANLTSERGYIKLRHTVLSECIIMSKC